MGNARSSGKLSPGQWQELLGPFLPAETLARRADLIPKLSSYLDLLLRWNAKTNLTSIREPAKIVQRHFGESLFAAQHLPCTGSLLDLGSGAGLPGLPTQLLHPELAVTLAESQGRKAAFLREVVRVLELPTVIWPHRAETLPAERTFDIVTMRAVDRMQTMTSFAVQRCTKTLCLLAGTDFEAAIPLDLPDLEFTTFNLPLSSSRKLLLARRR